MWGHIVCWSTCEILRVDQWNNMCLIAKSCLLSTEISPLYLQTIHLQSLINFAKKNKIEKNVARNSLKNITLYKGMNKIFYLIWEQHFITVMKLMHDWMCFQMDYLTSRRGTWRWQVCWPKMLPPILSLNCNECIMVNLPLSIR